VDLLTSQVAALQHKLDVIPERVADKTITKVKEVVIEKEVPSAKPTEKP